MSTIIQPIMPAGQAVLKNAAVVDLKTSKSAEPGTGGVKTEEDESRRERIGQEVARTQRRVAERAKALQDSSAYEGQTEWDDPVPFSQVNVPSFPTTALPPWLRAFAEALADSTQVPTDLVAMVALSAVSAAVARKIEVEVSEGYSEPVNLYTVTALPPANRKSAVVSEVSAPIREYEEAEARLAEPGILAARNMRAIAETRLERLQRQAARAAEEDVLRLANEARQAAQDISRMAMPVVPRLLANNATPEKLTSLLAEQGGRLAVLSPEGEVFDLASGRYGNKGTQNFDVFLNGHAGDDIRVDRVGRPAEFVKRPALTLGLAVQPEVIRGLAEKPGFRGRGLLARFLYSMPTSLVGSRKVDTAPVPTVVRGEYMQRMRVLLRLPYRYDNAQMPQPYLLLLTPEAKAALTAFSQEIEPQLGETGDLGPIADWGGKLVGAVTRIAGLLHAASLAGPEAPWSQPIQRVSIEAAIAIGRYLIPHARAAFGLMNTDPDVEAAKYVLRAVKRKGLKVFSEREVFECTKGRFKTMDALVPVLRLLLLHQYIRFAQVPVQARRGRPSGLTYEVNPKAEDI